MKKMIKLVTLTLVVALMLSTVAFAAADIDNDLMTVTKETVTVPGYGDVTVTLTGDSSSDEIINLTVSGDPIVDGQYLLLMLKKDSNNSYPKIEENILFIDQQPASGKSVTFKVYPKDIETSALFVINKDTGEMKVAVIEGKFSIGDINKDGIVNIQDAVAIVRMILDPSIKKDEADMNNDNIINIQDAVAVVKIILTPKT